MLNVKGPHHIGFDNLDLHGILFYFIILHRTKCLGPYSFYMLLVLCSLHIIWVTCSFYIISITFSFYMWPKFVWHVHFTWDKNFNLLFILHKIEMNKTLKIWSYVHFTFNQNSNPMMYNLHGVKMNKGSKLWLHVHIHGTMFIHTKIYREVKTQWKELRVPKWKSFSKDYMWHIIFVLV